MKIKLTPAHINFLQSIALQAVQAQHKGEIDTGPGGTLAEFEKELRDMDYSLSYWLETEEERENE